MIIGFIGLGHMGNPMAQHLLKNGFKLYVYDVVPHSVETMVLAGATSVRSVADIAEMCDVVFTSVQNTQQVIEICLAENGLFSHAKKNLLYIDCSSIDVNETRQLHQEAEKREIAMLDAPVSGGVGGAIAGSLTFMVGGTNEHFQRAQPILAMMGKKIIHAGQAGNGQAAKICNNLLLGVSMIGVAEAFTLANKLGLDQKKFFEISSNSSGQCWSMTVNCPVPGILDHAPSNHDFQPGFMAKMMLKDLQLAHHAAESVGISVPLGSVAAELYRLYVNQGFGERDFSGIINLINPLQK